MTTWAEWLAENTNSPEETARLKTNRLNEKLNEDLADIESFRGTMKHDHDAMDPMLNHVADGIPKGGKVGVHYHKPSNMTSVIHADHTGTVLVGTMKGHYNDHVIRESLSENLTHHTGILKHDVHGLDLATGKHSVITKGTSVEASHHSGGGQNSSTIFHKDIIADVNGHPTDHFTGESPFKRMMSSK